MKTIRTLLAAALALLAPALHAATVQFAGVINNDADSQISQWRTAGTPKTHDADGDHLYGTTARLLFGVGSFGQGTVFSFDGSDTIVGPFPGYATVDDVNGGADVQVRTTTNNAVPGADRVMFTFTALAGCPSAVRIGVATDGLDYGFVSPASLGLRQVGGSSAEHTLAAGDRSLDMVFFTVSGVKPGDQFQIFGDPSTSDYATIQLVTWDALVVMNAGDNGPGSLRAALATAASTVGPDTITFASGLTGGIINLTTVTNPGSGDTALDIADAGGVTIDASALPGGITLNGAGAAGSYRLIQLSSGSLTLRGLTLANGGGSGFAAYGGAIANNGGTLTLERCTLRDNKVGGGPFGGGAILNNGGAISLTCNHCTFSGNSFTGSADPGSSGGGAVNNRAGTPATFTHCTFSGNTTNQSGGAILTTTGTSVTLTNTIAAGNSAGLSGPELGNWGTITANGNNLISGAVIFAIAGPGSVANSGNFIGIPTPLPSTLGNWGGGTQTFYPLAGSPARDAVGVTNVAGLSTDQRGAPLPGSLRDIGAVEAGGSVPGLSLVVTTAADEMNGVDVNGVSLREAVTLTPAGGTITFAAPLNANSVIGLTDDLTLTDVTLDTAISGGAVDVAVNVGTLRFEGGSVWTGGGQILLGDTNTNSSADATVEVNGPDGFTLVAPITVRAGSSGLKKLRAANVTGTSDTTNIFAGAITLQDAATVERVDGSFSYQEFVDFTGPMELGPHPLTVEAHDRVYFSGSVGRSDAGNDPALLLKNGSGPLYLGGSDNNPRLTATVAAGGLFLRKMGTGPGLHALGSGLDAGTTALTMDAGKSVTVGSGGSGGDQIANDTSVTVNGSLSLGASEILHALTGSGTVRPYSASPLTLTLGAASGDFTFTGSLNHDAGGVATLSLTKTGNGTQTVAGGDMSGTVQVNGGTLNVTGSLPNVASTTVASGATLGGGGTVVNLTLASGSFLAPGAAGSIGTLNVANRFGSEAGTGSLTWHGGATARFHLSGTDNASDKVTLAAQLVKGSGSGFVFDFQNTGTTGQTYTLATFTSSSFTAADFTADGVPAGLFAGFTKTATALTVRLFPAAAFTVSSSADSGPGSLREALDAAATTPGADTITFAPGLSGPITLSSGEIIISSEVTLDATSLPSGLTIDGGTGLNRIFTVNSGQTVVLKNLTLTGGNGGGASANGDGGAILNFGTLTLTHCTLSNNSASGDGGAILNFNTLTLTHCTLSDNSASGDGGAILNFNTLTLTHCTLSDNSASGDGGAILNFNTLTLTHCTLSNNTSNFNGGAIHNHDTGTLTLTNTIAAGNTAPTDPNIDGSFSGTNNLTSGDPRLAPLGNYGGPTQTMALLPGSPALDAAAATALLTDQRGFTRSRDGNAVAGAAPDIGAYEAQVAPFGSLGFNFQDTNIASGAVLAASDIAGAPGYAQANWNGLTGFNSGLTANTATRTDATGTTVPGLQLWWKGPNTYGIGGSADTVDKKLMFGYLDSNGTGDGSAATDLFNTVNAQPYLAIAGLPAAATLGGYRVVVYADTDNATGRISRYWLTSNRAQNPASVGGESALTGPLFTRDTANFSGTYTRATATTDTGAATPAANYAVFESLTEPGGFILRAEEGSLPVGGQARAPINAVQFIRNEIIVVTTAADELDPNGTLGTGISLREALRDAPDGAGILFDSTLNGATLTLSGEIVIGKSATIDASNLSGGVTIDGGAGTNRIFTVNSGQNVSMTALTLSGGQTTQVFPTGSGAGILNSGTLTLTRCTLTNNNATNAHGGALMNATGGTMTLLHCTLFGNSTGPANRNGGGIYNAGALALTHCTVSGNSSPFGAGIFNEALRTTTITNSIIAGNTGSTDIRNPGTLTGLGVNIIPTLANPSAGTSTGTRLTTDPLLAPLNNYGGPTQTMALLPGSPARNAATGSIVTSDQRGFPIVGARDIGAYEAGTTNTFALWAIENVGAGTVTFGADQENDGNKNGLEYATRTNPLVANASPFGQPALIAGPAYQFSFPYRPGATDLRYVVQRSPDLATWTEIYRADLTTSVVTEVGLVTGDENAGTQVITLTDPGFTTPACFWKLIVEKP